VGNLFLISCSSLITGKVVLVSIERRRANRFQIQLPLVVRWAGGAAVGEAATQSRDVSARGIYFMLPKEIERGSPVEIVMTLPHDITMVGPVRVSCLGRIQRTEPQPDRRVGVVATLGRYEFLRSDGNAA